MKVKTAFPLTLSVVIVNRVKISRTMVCMFFKKNGHTENVFHTIGMKRS